MPEDPYAQIAKPAATDDPYAAIAKPISQEEPGFLDKEIPLTSYKNATLSGVQSIARGTRDAVSGIYTTIRHPIDTAKGLMALPGQVSQVPAAIHDINQSVDPVGTYAKVAQETAGQGAPQALLAAGMASAPVAARVVAPYVKPLARTALRTASDIVDPDVTGIASPRLAHAQRLAGRIADKLEPKPVYPGASLPEAPPLVVTQARGLAEGARPVTSQGGALANIPVRAPIAEPPSTVVPRAIQPAEVQEKLGEALGNKPVTIKPGVKIRDQFKTESVPEGHTAVESTAVKSFKYDPAARELHVVAKDGTTHVYGEVTPDQAEAFANADSKGQAWKAIRDNNVKLAKISPQGVRTANKGASEFKAAAPDDLTPILTKSLAAVKKPKP